MTRPPQRVQLGPRDRKVMTVTGPSGVSTASTWANVRFRMRHCAGPRRFGASPVARGTPTGI